LSATALTTLKIALLAPIFRDGVDDAEDRAVGADPQRQRQHGDEGEAGGAQQQAAGADDVLPQRGQVLGESHGSVPVAGGAPRRGVGQREVAEAAARLGLGGGRRHAVRDQLPRQHLDVEVELRAHLVGDGGAPDRAVQLLR
jgi:hypothetical protein